MQNLYFSNYIARKYIKYFYIWPDYICLETRYTKDKYRQRWTTGNYNLPVLTEVHTYLLLFIYKFKSYILTAKTLHRSFKLTTAVSQDSLNSHAAPISNARSILVLSEKLELRNLSWKFYIRPILVRQGTFQGQFRFLVQYRQRCYFFSVPLLRDQ